MKHEYYTKTNKVDLNVNISMDILPDKPNQ